MLSWPYSLAVYARNCLEFTIFQFIEYLYSEENSLFLRRETVDENMDSPLSHYWIASSHNT